jgi:hypothetical protein
MACAPNAATARLMPIVLPVNSTSGVWLHSAEPRKKLICQDAEGQGVEMILVDTSVWIHHFRKTDQELVGHLNTGSVVCHPFIIGELACGNLGHRAEDIFLSR